MDTHRTLRIFHDTKRDGKVRHRLTSCLTDPTGELPDMSLYAWILSCGSAVLYAFMIRDIAREVRDQ